MSEIKILNEPTDSDVSSDPISPIELSKKLFQAILRLKGKFLDEFKVDYVKLRQTSEFGEFETRTGQLVKVNLATVSKQNERKAFFLNVYNTLTLHSMAVSVTNEKDVIELKGFWQLNGYRIGEFVYSLDDIEHGILRCNKLHPTTKEHFFKCGDLRAEFVESHLDPRIHFALNCGAKSCPPIRLFSDDNIDKALDMATQTFCQNDVLIDLQAKTVTLTKIFLWYGEDFGPDTKSILKWILEYLSDEQKDALNFLLEDGEFKIQYGDYNWNIV